MSEMTMLGQVRKSFFVRPKTYSGLLAIGITFIIYFFPSMTTPACGQLCLEQLLDFDQYDTAAEFRSEFGRHFKRGDDVSQLLNKLEEKSDKHINDPDYWGFPDLPYPIRVVAGKVFSSRLDRFELTHNDSVATTSKWRIELMHRRGILGKASVLRFFEDEDFATRGLPFRLEYFLSGDAARRALRNQIIGEPNPENIESLMSKIGATVPGVREQTNEIGAYKLTYKYVDSFENYIDPPTLKYWTGGVRTIIWFFDSESNFAGVGVNAPGI